MISIDRLKEMTLEDIENNPEKYLEEYTELLQQFDQLKAENEGWKKANDEKNELLAKLGCPTTATAKRKAHCLQEQLDKLKAKCERLELQLTSLSYADTICALEIDLKHKTQECEQAEQKLKRIRQILKNGVKIHDDIIVNKSILQIIDEVE